MQGREHIKQINVVQYSSYAYGSALLLDDARWELPTFERPMVYGQKAEASSSGLKVVVHLYQTRNDIPYHNLHTHTHTGVQSPDLGEMLQSTDRLHLKKA